MKILTIKGIVVEGQKRGRLLGFPTANLQTELLLPEGIYASKVSIGRKEYLAATFVGSPKTYGEEDYKVESYILDFNVDLYGKEITVSLYKKVRKNKKFATEDALILQMKKDIQTIRTYFMRRGKSVVG